ncbi:SNF2 family N-terminal domain-containing protein [Xylariaceae sp. FL0255]|nr:SNF2 family N-terminal domain-containing protein [Xylariaceae sp. FL0255]
MPWVKKSDHQSQPNRSLGTNKAIWESRKPGDSFGFRPKNNLGSIDRPTFYDDSHTITMPREQAPPKAPPLRESNASINSQPQTTAQSTNKNAPGFSNPTSSGSWTLPARPAVKERVYSGGKSMDDKYANLFIQPKNRPEHHRPQRIQGPLQQTYKDKKPAPAPLFSSIVGPQGSASNPITLVDSPPSSRYTQPGVFAQYVDPQKSAEDIKALLEGSLEDDEEKLVEEGAIKDKSQVEGLKVRLLPHQVEGVEWMKNRELGPVKKGKVPKGGLLADDMGLGKTLQSISLILTNAKPDDKHPGVEKTTLVVAPLALIRQWEAELKDKVETTHRLKVVVHHGPQRTKRFEDLKKYDVVITTYQILVSEHGHSLGKLKVGCFGLHWYRVILDEAHTIKNRNAKATKACYELQSVYRWCLSGTPMQNNLDELQSLVKFLRIKPYDDLQEWRDHFDRLMKSGRGDVAIRRLHSVLQCFMKRRTKDILKQAGALGTGSKKDEDGEKSATSSFKVTERKVVAIAAQFGPAERRFYERLEQRTDKSLEAMMKGKVNYASALVLLLRLRQACNHPKLVEGKLEKDKDALSDETRPKKNDADVDDLADLLGGLGVEAKHCEICGWVLDQDTRQPGSDKCKSCYEDLEYFKHHEEGGELKAPKTRKVYKKKKTEKKSMKKVVEKAKAVSSESDEESDDDVPIKRKPRNRRAILMDSDDEEAEGEWIVSGDEQGALHLGKAGGTDDENAEGEGETINSEDSEEEESKDGSRLDSFVVDDGEDTKPEDLRRAIEASDSDDSDLESLTKVFQKLSHKKNSKPKPVDDSSDTDSESEEEEEDDDESDSEEGIDESELYDNDDQENDWRFLHQVKRSVPQVLASAKIRQLATILHKEIDEHKFIVFSQFTSMLDLVEPFLRKDGVKYVRYDGSMKNDAREAALNSLRNDKSTRVLLCSLRCGALGLNLTAASRVVILEPFWNPFVEEQAIDRVHRLTQTVDVVVYKLTVENTVEERILELQEKKRLLAQTAIEGGAKKDALKLGLKEMLDLFKHAADRIDEGKDDYGVVGHAAQRDLHSIAHSSKAPSRKGAQESAVYGRRW